MNDYELIVGIDGSICFNVNEMVLVVEQGCVLLIPPGVTHRAWASSETSSYFFVHFDCVGKLGVIDTRTNPKAEEKDEYNLTPHCYHIPQSDRISVIPGFWRLRKPDKVWSLFDVMLMERDKKEEGYERVISIHIALIFLAIHRDWCSHGESTQRSSKTAIVGRAISYIDSNYNRKLTLTQIGLDLSISPDYLSRLFKEITGYSVMPFLNRHRIDMATRFFRRTQMNVTEVAIAVGIPDLKYFSRLFKSYIGVLPSDFRKSVKLPRSNQP